MDRLLLKVDEATQLTGLGRSKIYELLASGQLRSIAVGRARRIPADALRDWIAEQVSAAELAETDQPTEAARRNDTPEVAAKSSTPTRR